MTDDDPREKFRIDLTSDEDVSKADWDTLMQELETVGKELAPPGDEAEEAEAPPSPAVTQPEPQEVETPATTPETARSRYEELCRTPSMKMEAGDLEAMTRLSEVIGKINEALRNVEKLEEADTAGEFPERFTKLWTQNLKDTVTVLMKEFHALRHGRYQKKYDKKFICKECHGVFMAPLPGGICDECRANHRPQSQ